MKPSILAPAIYCSKATRLKFIERGEKMRKYRNLAAEIVRSGMTISTLGKEVNISTSMMSRKINGRSSFTVPEAISIWNALNRPCPFEVLFALEER